LQNGIEMSIFNFVNSYCDSSEPDSVFSQQPGHEKCDVQHKISKSIPFEEGDRRIDIYSGPTTLGPHGNRDNDNDVKYEYTKICYDSSFLDTSINPHATMQIMQDMEDLGFNRISATDHQSPYSTFNGAVNETPDLFSGGSHSELQKLMDVWTYQPSLMSSLDLNKQTTTVGASSSPGILDSSISMNSYHNSLAFTDFAAVGGGVGWRETIDCIENEVELCDQQWR
jgi:hypothetical protein